MSMRFARFTCYALAAGACPVHAFQLDYTLEAALGHSDNINQSENHPIGESILIPRLNFDFNEDGEYLRAHAVGQVEYRDYLQGHFDNEARGQLSALAMWIISPQRFHFDFEDHASVQPVNVLAPNTPNNQQQTNVFSLGPTFDFRLMPTLKGQAELRFSDSTASRDKEFNSRRGTAALRAIKDLNPHSKLSANAEYQRVHFTNRAGGPDYRRGDAFARYQSKLPQLDLDLALGWSNIDFAHGGARSRSGALARGSIAWHATPSNTFGLGFARQYADASVDLVTDPSAFIARVPGSAIVTGSLPITSQVYLEKRVDASWQYQTARFGVRVQPYHRTLDYLIDRSFDQKINGGIVGVSYRPRPLWTLAFDAGDEARRYSFIDRRDEDRRYDLSFTDQLTRQWSGRLDLIRNERHSTAAQQSFRENVAFATVIFKR